MSLQSIREKYKKGEKIVMLTAYDALLAEWLAHLDVDMILVGDSLGMTCLGYETTIPVTVEDMIHHARAVRRGAPRSFIVVDMPFMSYQVSPEDAVRNAGRIVKETLCDAVKIEGGAETVPVVERLTAAGIPVMGHIGLNPQKILKEGGYRVKGKGDAARAALQEDAVLLEKAGVFSLVIETVPQDLAGKLTGAISIPTIGIGAGSGTSGQVLVTYDLLGLYDKMKPKFVKRYRELGKEALEGISEFIEEVKTGRFPDDEHSFH